MQRRSKQVCAAFPCLVFSVVFAMAAPSPHEIKAYRQNLRRIVKHDWYRMNTPLSTYKLQQALAVWWAADRQLCMALRYLHMQYMLTVKRLGIQQEESEDFDVGAGSPTSIPENWRTKLEEKIAGASEADLDALRAPQDAGVRRKRVASTFLMEVALASYVEKHNRCGRSVSTRAVLERKGMLLEPIALHTHSHLQPLSRAENKWVARWQRRHGLTRGRFRTGAGLTDAQQRIKVLRFHHGHS